MSEIAQQATRPIRTRSVTWAAILAWVAIGWVLAALAGPDRVLAVVVIAVAVALMVFALWVAHRVRRRRPEVVPAQINAACTAGIAFMHLALIFAVTDAVLSVVLRSPSTLLDITSEAVEFVVGFVIWRVAASALADRGIAYRPNSWLRRTWLGLLLAAAAWAAFCTMPILAALPLSGALVVVSPIAALALFVGALVADNRIESHRERPAT